MFKLLYSAPASSLRDAGRTTRNLEAQLAALKARDIEAGAEDRMRSLISEALARMAGLPRNNGARS